MYLGYPEEGDICKEINCNGILKYNDVEICSCHISPPCDACTSNRLTCDECGWEDESPEYKEVYAGPGLSMREYRPRPLDNTKIDYRAKSHTNASMIKEGVYPEGTTSQEVEEVVKGTFGGRFAGFGDGKFKYIAYTD